MSYDLLRMNEVLSIIIIIIIIIIDVGIEYVVYT
jgi:hypothetical protein